MMRMIMKVFRERWDELQWALILCGITWLAGNVLVAVILYIDSSKDIYELSSLIMGIVMLVYVLIVGIYGFATEFNLAVGMGISRKRFVPAYLIVSLLNEILLFGLFCAGYFIEHLELRIFYGVEKSSFDIMFVVGSWYVPLALLLLAALQLFFGSLKLKFGQKGMWVFWLLWMMMCVVPGRIVNSMEHAPDSVLGKLGNGGVKIAALLGTGGLVVLTTGALAVMIGVTYLTMRRQQVTSS